MNDFKNDDILKDKQDHDRMSWMEELRMMPVYQVFIMVLVQGATRSDFHHRTNLFYLYFCYQGACFQVFTKAHFFSFFSFWIFRVFGKNSSLFEFEECSYWKDKPRP